MRMGHDCLKRVERQKSNESYLPAERSLAAGEDDARNVIFDDENRPAFCLNEARPSTNKYTKDNPINADERRKGQDELQYPTSLD